MTALKSSDSPFSVSIDSKTGMPNGLIIEDSKGEISRSIAVSMSVEIGGTEHRNHHSGSVQLDGPGGDFGGGSGRARPRLPRRRNH